MSEALKRVERAAKKQAKASCELRDAIRSARAQGESLRAIAKVAGVSHIAVRNRTLDQ
ncbi:MAG: hypothetical protein M3P18_26260 [Actinomycetota bacterium]|nr:hypothetical protein [Actinomycetota bacterium]